MHNEYFRYADDTTLIRRTKETLDESERGSEKVGLKLNIQKTKHGIWSLSLHDKLMRRQWKQ